MVAELVWFENELKDKEIMDMYDDADFSETPYPLVGGGHDTRSATTQVSTKIPPSFDGQTSWFAYEDAVMDWLDVTELEAAKRGPALKTKLVGNATVFRGILDRDSLKSEEGPRYFLNTPRPQFVKARESV